MTVGLRIRGANGVYQIDENTIVLSILQSGALSALPSAAGPTDNSTVYTGTFVGELAMMGLYIPASSGYFGGVIETSLSGSTWTFKIILWPRPGITPRSIANIKWFVFARPRGKTAGVGLRFYSPDGKLRFSSQWRVAEIKGVENTTIDPARRYAAVGGTTEWSRTVETPGSPEDPPASTRVNAIGIYSNAGGVWTANEPIYAGDGAGGPSGTTTVGVTQPAFAVDVTDYT